MPFGVECETSSSQPCISQYRRPCTFYLFLDREMLRWYITASQLTAFSQSLADQDFSGTLFNLSARYRVNFDKKYYQLCANDLFLLFFNIIFLYFLLLVMVVLTFYLFRF